MDLIAVCGECIKSSNATATVVVATAALLLAVGRDLVRARWGTLAAPMFRED
jgi:hypothetical protein